MVFELLEMENTFTKVLREDKHSSDQEDNHNTCMLAKSKGYGLDLDLSILVPSLKNSASQVV